MHNDEWNTGTGVECADKCSKLEKQADGVIDIPLEVVRVIREMCREFPEHEWQMLLKGVVARNGRDVLVTGYYVPAQTVTGTTVRNEDVITPEWIKENGIIAGIHSHVDMGVFFSSVDEETNRSAIRYHVVTNNRGEYVARGRYSLACGMEGFKDMKVSLGEEEVARIKVEGIEKVKKYEAPVYDYTEQIEFSNSSQHWADTYGHKRGTLDEFSVKEDTLKDGYTEGGYFYDAECDVYYLDNGTTFEGRFSTQLGE